MKQFRFPLDLQLFSDYEDDAILPDNFVESTPQDNDTPAEDTNEPEFEESLDTTAEDTTPADEPTETLESVTQPQKVKIKFNHEEREIDIEEAAALAQKGMNYEKAVERARQEAAQQARDEVIASMQMIDYDGNPITTEARYQEVLREKEIREKYSDLPDELRQELLESRRDREERQREKAEREKEAQQKADFDEFFRYFESVNNRKYDPEKDKFPPELIAAVNNGQPLKYAYMEHHNRELMNRLKIASQNQANLQKSPVGSVTAGGGTKTEAEDDFLAGFNSV